MFDTIFGFLSGVGGSLGGFGIAQAIAAILSIIGQIANYLLGVQLAIGNYLYQGAVLQGLSHAFGWVKFFTNIFTKTLAVIGRFLDWLDRKLAPILKFLEKVRAWLDKIFNKYIKPILNLIHRIRAFLAILRLFGVKWAEALDRRLAQVETQITKVFLEVRGHLNRVIDVLNAITDPAKLIHMAVFIAAGRRVAAIAVRVMTGMPIGFFFPSFLPGARPYERPIYDCKDFDDFTLNPSPSRLAADIIAQGFLSTAPTEQGWGMEHLDDLPVLDFFLPGQPGGPACAMDFDEESTLHVTIGQAFKLAIQDSLSVTARAAQPLLEGV